MAPISVEALPEEYCENKPSRDSEKLVEEIRDTIDKQSVEIKLLHVENSKLRTLNMLLQESLLQKGNEGSFTDIPGYPSTEWLLSVSQNSGDSDYLFIKELMLQLSPQGVGNATATGRPSNNPHGCKKEPINKDSNVQRINKLDPEKVKYMKDRVYERRRILQDPVGIAMTKAKMINKHIANVIANNPSLRNEPKPLGKPFE
ncbi:uncharacterized protein LOC131432837 [Malaya genurostris]|uniref:uncharacterized protein LOC131432837 n=1 Tax=Malaya genurostris TaxID=325434 RepID=UPI0026F37DBF|nr:uncharacterized protein LOC131432837 [Malaya genurostris]